MSHAAVLEVHHDAFSFQSCTSWCGAAAACCSPLVGLLRLTGLSSAVATCTKSVARSRRNGLVNSFKSVVKLMKVDGRAFTMSESGAVDHE